MEIDIRAVRRLREPPEARAALAPMVEALPVCYGNRYADLPGVHYDFLFPAVPGVRVDQLVLEFTREGLDDLRLITEYAWPSAVGSG